jgi:hypothetical protein
VARAALAELPAALCRTFLGWRLREDWDALVALGEGALRIDLLSGEAWCDGDPIPPLFIAGELQRELSSALAAADPEPPSLRAARLDAAFQVRRLWRAERQVPSLEITCRVTLAGEEGEVSAEANNAALPG